MNASCLTDAPRLWCVVPAAGVGKRFGAAVPKQYLILNQQTVIEHTLQRLLSIPCVEKIIVALSAEDARFESLSIASESRLVSVEGGEERSDSVRNGLLSLSQYASKNDWVLVHDVARPCVRVNDVLALLDQVEVASAIGGILAHPVRDTMKRANASCQVTETVDRDCLWHALTPQLFRVGELLQALILAEQDKAQVTDEASAMERLGHSPLLVEGHSDNIKITHPQDLQLAALYLQQQMKAVG